MTSSPASDTARIGVVTDIQYADKQDGYVDYAGCMRRYSQVLPRTEHAVEYLNQQDISFVLHLGDIIDGNVTQSQTHQDLQRVMQRLSLLKVPVLHTLGNHCLAADRQHLLQQLDLEKATYYYRDISSKWRLIALDTVDVSVDVPTHHPNYERAVQYLQQHKGEPNAEPWNGGVGPEQLKWLRQTLRETQQQQMFAIVCGHLPVFAEASSEGHIIWDSHVLADLFREFADVVKAYFAGHYHEGGYACVDDVHHVTFEAILDANDAKGACGVVELSDTNIVIKGHGVMTSRNLPIA